MLTRIVFVISSFAATFPSSTLAFTPSAHTSPVVVLKQGSTIERKAVLLGTEDVALPTPTISRPAEVPPPSRPNLAYFQRLRLRLNTHEDKHDAHKWSASIFSLSGLGILAVGAQCGFQDIPTVLQTPTLVWAASTIAQAVTSLQMNAQYRKNDMDVKEGFDNMSYSLLQSVWLALYSSPFAPEVANNFWFSTSITLLLTLPIIHGGVNELMHLPAKIEHRGRRNKEKGGDLGRIGDFFAYAMSSILPLTIALVVLTFVCDPTHDRQWFLHNTDFPTGASFVSFGFYDTVLATLVAGFGAFAITLRDKKLISKDKEQMVLGTLNTLFASSLALQFGLF